MEEIENSFSLKMFKDEPFSAVFTIMNDYYCLTIYKGDITRMVCIFNSYGYTCNIIWESGRMLSDFFTNPKLIRSMCKQHLEWEPPQELLDYIDAVLIMMKVGCKEIV
jgi:hypothetical protein